MALQLGLTILNGKYRILKLIGEGGMARVWLAEEPGFGGRQVAIKEPLTDQLEEHERQEFASRFRQEIKLAPQMEQARVPNMVATYTVERMPDGNRLLVMEYIEGGSVADLIASHPSGLPIGQAVVITQDVLQALVGFHRLPGAPVHRDIKPENVLLDGRGRARLCDVGLAQLPGSSGRTQLLGGPHPGTPLYMAPEQGRSSDPLVPAADLYSLGCVLFEMLTGRRYRRVRPGTSARDLRPEIPKGLEQVLLRALAEDPWDRYATAEQMADALAALSDAGIKQTGPPSPPPGRASCSGWFLVLGGVGGLAALLLVVLLLTLLLNRGELEKFVRSIGVRRPTDARVVIITDAYDPSLIVMPSRTSTQRATSGSGSGPTNTPTRQVLPPTSMSTRRATSTPKPTNTPTRTLLPPTATPRPSSKPSCRTPVYGGFQGIRNVDWSVLGCPSAAASTGIWMAKESFESGQMLWREDNQDIYARYDSGRWQGFVNSWYEGQPEYSCPEFGTQSPPVPKRGFGKVWCESPNVRNQLGAAVTEESGFYGTVQDFATGGHIVQMDTGRVFVFYPTGGWVHR